jgi:hypothetical protein
VVSLRDGDDECESWFNFSPALLAQLGVEDGERTVRRTAEFLVERQGVADFPDIVDLEDVIATYADYGRFIAQQESAGRP